MQRHHEPAQFGIFPGTGLETHRNSSTVPLVWCWHPNSNLDPTRSRHTVDGMDVFALFYHPQPKPDPYFTARYAGAMDKVT